MSYQFLYLLWNFAIGNMCLAAIIKEIAYCFENYDHSVYAAEFSNFPMIASNYITSFQIKWNQIKKFSFKFNRYFFLIHRDSCYSSGNMSIDKHLVQMPYRCPLVKFCWTRVHPSWNIYAGDFGDNPIRIISDFQKQNCTRTRI